MVSRRTHGSASWSRGRILRTTLALSLLALLMAVTFGVGGPRPQDQAGTRLLTTVRVGHAQGAVWMGGGYWPVLELYATNSPS